MLYNKPLQKEYDWMKIILFNNREPGFLGYILQQVMELQSTSDSQAPNGYEHEQDLCISQNIASVFAIL